MIRAYLKLARSFNAGLTAIAPVLGAISNGEANLYHLFLFFLVGFFGHSYGFALNDIIDYRVDKLSKELNERPLVKGELTLRQAWAFTISMLIIAFFIAAYVSSIYSNYFPLIYLIISAISITIYDSISKKYPAMDIFVAAGIFFLIIYGAAMVGKHINTLTWVISILGTMQVLFMQFIAGGLKDAEHDYIGNANTLAIKLGVRVINRKLTIPLSFKFLAYILQLVYLFFLFLPFYILSDFRKKIVVAVLLVFLATTMLFISYKLLSMKTFNRNEARKYIGLHYYINFSLVPIMLSCINPWIALLALLPPVAFLLSNITLHGSVLPKTM